MREFESLCRIKLVVLDESSSPWNLRDISLGECRSGSDNVEVDVDWGCVSVGCCRGDDFIGGEVCLCGFDLLWGNGRAAISGWGVGGLRHTIGELIVGDLPSLKGRSEDGGND